MRHSTPVKTLVILDKDNCELDTLEVFGALEETLSQLAAKRGLPVELLHDLTREAEGEHRFNDAIRLIDHMNEVEPRFKTDNKDHREADTEVKLDWLKKTSDLSRFYQDNLETLKKWHEIGTNVVTKTDCERLPLLRRVWLTALNAYLDYDLNSPYEILSLYDHIYCKPSLHEPQDQAAFDDYLRHFCETNSIPFAFASGLNSHITVFRDEHKPSLSHMSQILKDYPTHHNHILYIGDNYKDGMEGQIVNPSVDFAWAKYGADWKPKVQKFYQQVGSKSYRYGVEAISEMFTLHSVNIKTVLERSIAEVFDHFDFRAGWNLSRRSIDTARDYERQASQNLGDYRAAPRDFKL